MDGSFLGCLIFVASVEVTCYEERVVGRKSSFVIPSVLLHVSSNVLKSSLCILTSLQHFVPNVCTCPSFPFGFLDLDRFSNGYASLGY